MERSPGLQDETPPKDTWPKVAVIILNWNGWRDTIECLESVDGLTYPNYEVILVDNGSMDDSVAHISKWVMGRPARWGRDHYPANADSGPLAPGAEVVLRTDKLTFIRLPENFGFSGGNNIAIDYVLSSQPRVGFVFLLNNDARIDQKCLSKCVEVALREDAAIVGAVAKNEDGTKVTFAGARFPLELFRAAEVSEYPSGVDCWPVDRVLGSGILIRRDLLERRRDVLGYYLDPHLFLYCEETELCVTSATNWGYKVIMARDAVVYHRTSGSSGGLGNPLSYYYITRNRVHLARALLPWRLKILFHVWYPFSRLARALQRAIEGKPEVSIAILEGLLDGYNGIGGKWRRHPS